MREHAIALGRGEGLFGEGRQQVRIRMRALGRDFVLQGLIRQSLLRGSSPQAVINDFGYFSHQ